MFNRYVLVTCFTCLAVGVFTGYSFNRAVPSKPLWINQEIRERVFLECTIYRNDVVSCGDQAKQIATVGNQSGEILFRPREDK